jgi:acyl-coenzyme A thioesterase PaaI-like protein
MPSPPIPKAPWSRRLYYWLINIYGPYAGAGISCSATPDLRRFEVTMRQRPWNRNVYGTHFGGSLYSMCDPFFVLILTEQLGKGYIVWDKAATIRFLRPGKGTVKAIFELPPGEPERIAAEVEANGKAEPTYTVEVKDEAGEVVAQVEKLLYVRKKRKQEGSKV